MFKLVLEKAEEPEIMPLGSRNRLHCCGGAHLLANILRSEKTITLLGCTTQMGLFMGLGSADCFLLASMAYDRHAAICHPLQYPIIMPRTLCAHLVVASVVLGLCLSFQLVAFVFSLPFCPARVQNHCRW